MASLACETTSYDPRQGGSSTIVRESGNVDADGALAQIRRAYEANDLATAISLGTALDESTLSRWSDTQRDDLWRLLASAWVALGDVSAAQTAIGQLSQRAPSDYLLIARVCELQEDPTCTADGYIQASLDYGYGHPDLPADIHDRIWRALTAARARNGQLGPTAFSHRYHFAWWLLQQELRQAQSVREHIDAWRAWRTRFPSHPASLDPPSAFARYDQYTVPKVGVILPLSGQLANAGQAVRDGFIAALLAQNQASANTSQQIETVFYDSAAMGLGQIAERVEMDGVDAIVGPLLKNNADEFAAITATQNRPLLLLNYVGDLSQPVAPGTPYQVGMAIEDEASSLSEHVLAQGHKKILVVHNQERWAMRALASIADQWPYPLLSAPFENIQGLTDAVGVAMDVDASHRRLNEIAAIIEQPVEFSPRARGDLDGVIALTNQTESLSLIPALRFHFADHLPVYATSQTLRGNQTRSLSGIRVTEMPLHLGLTDTMAELTQAYGLQNSALSELYALGHDALQIAAWLPILSPNLPLSLSGASGTLSMEPGGRFRRSLDVVSLEPPTATQ